MTSHLHSLSAEKLLLTRFDAIPAATNGMPACSSSNTLMFHTWKALRNAVIAGFASSCHKVVIFAA
jgi:hypothetical protein